MLQTKLGVLTAAPFVSAQVEFSGYVVVQFPLLVICHTAVTPDFVHVAFVALPLPMHVARQVPPTVMSQFVAHFAFGTSVDGMVLHRTAVEQGKQAVGVLENDKIYKMLGFGCSRQETAVFYPMIMQQCPASNSCVIHVIEQLPCTLQVSADASRR